MNIDDQPAPGLDARTAGLHEAAAAPTTTPTKQKEMEQASAVPPPLSGIEGNTLFALLALLPSSVAPPGEKPPKKG